MNVTFINYPNASNISTMPSMWDYSGEVMAAGFNMATTLTPFGALVLGGLFVGFLIIGMKTMGGERALVLSSFFSTLIAFIMVSGQFLHPMWMALMMLIFIIALFFWSLKT